MSEQKLNDEWVPMSVPVPLAQEWIGNWINANADGERLDPREMRAFVVRKADFVELLNQVDTEYVRLYVGRKKETNEATGLEHLRPCLLLVSAATRKDVMTVNEGQDPDTIVDLIGEMTVTNPASTIDDPAETYDYQVFDFTRPCPPRCDDESDLFITRDGEDKSFC
ncbi:hypothetical protein [Arsenicibacter rosenii]|uniref:Uncharacterized protein n=1 Tax=Arsenicibacter rosenii TaxID=1750698 RepID=A0A1S2VKC0_9BACT|nr:hypothetical protein [Arsenicibacter rosenii]OIN59194.1 hypothetical protein BLX24_09370 [Arsenicibacter rosenii]